MLDPKTWTDKEMWDLVSRRPLGRMEEAMQEAAREEIARRGREQEARYQRDKASREPVRETW